MVATPTISDLMLNWRSLLSHWAGSGSLSQAARDAFEWTTEPARLRSLAESWSQGDFSELPSIIQDPVASAGATDAIVLDGAWLSSQSSEEVLRLLTEELGVWLQNQIGNGEREAASRWALLLLGPGDPNTQPMLLSEVTATAVAVDSSPPQLLGVSLNAHTVDLNDRWARQISLNLWLSDDSSGVESGNFVFRNQRTGYSKSFAFTADSNLVTGTRQLGWLSTSVSFQGYREYDLPYEDLGEWRLTSAEIRDRSNNIINTTALFAQASTELESLVFEVIHSGQIDDIDPPEITSASFSATFVDLTNPAGREIVLNLGIRDAGSGFSRGWVGLQSSTGTDYRWVSLNGISSLSAGNAKDGIFSGVANFGPYFEPGTWRIASLGLTDNQGQVLTHYGDLDSLLPGLGNLSFELINSQEADQKAPELIGVSLERSIVELRDPTKRKIAITIQASDNLSGVDYISLEFRSADDSQIKYAYASNPGQIAGGTATNATLSAQLEFDPFATPGEWKLASVYMIDRAGNSYYRNAGYDELPASLSSLSIQVDPGAAIPPPGADTTPVQLLATHLNATDFVLNPSEEAVLTLSLQAIDDQSGYSYGYFSFQSPSGAQALTINAGSLLSGDLGSGSFFGSVIIPTYSESGFWQLTSISTSDLASNGMYAYEESTIENLLPGLSTLGFTIHNSRQDLEAPHVQGAFLSAQSINLNQSTPTPLTVKLAIEDLGAGFESGWLLFQSPSGNQSVFLNYGTLLNGTRNSGVFQATSYLSPFSEAGVWTLSEYHLHDYAGNRLRNMQAGDHESPTQLFLAPLQDLHFEVINDNPDTTPPTLTFASLSQSSIDISAAELPPLSLSIGVSDDLSGYEGGYFQFTSPSGEESVAINMSRWNFVEGSLREGTFFGTTAPYATMELGQWTLTYASLLDEAGNFAQHYGQEELQEFLPGPGTLSFDVVATAPQPNQVSLALSTQVVHEKGQENFVYTATRTGDLSQPLQISYRVAGQATAGIDYSGIAATPLIQTLDFAAGSNSATITVTPLVDGIQEGAETVSLMLMPGKGYAIASIAPVVGTILDNSGQALFKVEGSAQVGSSLSASLEANDPEGNGNFAYLWESSADGNNWQPLGNDAASVVVTHAEQGRRVRLQIRYTDVEGYAELVSLDAGTVPAGPAPGYTSVGLDHVRLNQSPAGGEFNVTASLLQQPDGLPLQAIAVGASSLDMGGEQAFIDNTVSIEASVSTTGTTASAIGLNASTLQLRPGNDSLTIEAVINGDGPGASIAVRDSRVSGNRGDDTISLRGDYWGDRALIFGGAGNDSITGTGIGRDSFIQAGDGDDMVSLGRLVTTPGAAPLQRAKGDPIQPSTYRGGSGFDVLQLRETSQAVFEAQATAFNEGGVSGWLFQGARFLDFEQFLFG
jgi:hypothetical protein